MDNVSTFGSRLREIRLSKDMTQEEFAVLLDTSKQVISRYETNQRTPKITVAQDYADKLGIELDYLLKGVTVNSNLIQYFVSASEQIHINKYRALDDRGRTNVDNTLENEYQYILKQNERVKPNEPIEPIEPREEYIPETIAAHHDGPWTKDDEEDIAYIKELARKKKERDKQKSQLGD